MKPLRNQKTPLPLKSALLGALLVGTVVLAAARQSGAPTAASTENSDHTDQPIPPVDRRAPLTPKVLSLLAALTLDEKIALVQGDQDPASLGQAGYLPGVPRLGIPVRRDADALGIDVTADATALPGRPANWKVTRAERSAST
jgi:hypothetical protein